MSFGVFYLGARSVGPVGLSAATRAASTEG